MSDSHFIENLNVNASAREIEDYFERFEIWNITRKDVKDDRKTAFFLSAVGKEAYALVKNLAFLDSPISLLYEKLKDILLTHN